MAALISLFNLKQTISYIFLCQSSGSNQTETIANNKGDYGNHLRSRVQLLVTHRRVAHQAPLSMGILQAKMLEWVPCSPPGYLPNLKDHTQVSLTAGGFFII